MPVITIVVFDLDGVLCRYRIERRLARLAAWSGHSPEAIYAAIWRSGFEDAAERGVLSADDYLRGFGERLGYPLSAAQWVEARRVAIEPDLAVLALARQLSGERPVGMFTNNPWLLKRHMAKVFPAVPALFGTRAVVSAELGRSKPDLEAFRRLATRLACAPDELLYFDDDAAYVAGARLSREEERKLIAHAYRVQGTRGLLIKTLFQTGARVSEFVNITADEVFFEEQMILISKAKGGKSRYVPILPQLAQELRTHLGHRTTGYLFETVQHTPYSPRRIQQLVKETAADAGITKRVYPHLLRHSVATMLLERGMPIEQIQKFLGHSKLETTQIYAESSAEMIKESYQGAMAG